MANYDDPAKYIQPNQLMYEYAPKTIRKQKTKKRSFGREFIMKLDEQQHYNLKYGDIMTNKGTDGNIWIRERLDLIIKAELHKKPDKMAQLLAYTYDGEGELTHMIRVRLFQDQQTYFRDNIYNMVIPNTGRTIDSRSLMLRSLIASAPKELIYGPASQRTIEHFQQHYQDMLDNVERRARLRNEVFYSAWMQRNHNKMKELNELVKVSKDGSEVARACDEHKRLRLENEELKIKARGTPDPCEPKPEFVISDPQEEEFEI